MMPDTQNAVAPRSRDDRDDLLIYQLAAAEAGFFRTCRLPRCRRAQRCAGCRRPGGEGCDLPDAADFPPCITTEDDVRRLAKGVSVVARQIREACALFPDEEQNAFVIPPPEGLPRVRTPGRHGGRRRRGRAKTQETPSASAEIQNTASCDSAVSSQTKSRCGNSSSRISRPEPISQIMPPSGLR
jgi:hypothetical protein